MGGGGAVLVWVSAALAAAPTAQVVEAGLVCATGEQLGGARVEAVLQHPEFERCELRLPDGAALTVELVGGAAAGSGACDAQGYALQPRWELLGREVAREDQPPAVVALCARLPGLPAYTPPSPWPYPIASGQGLSRPPPLASPGSSGLRAWASTLFGLALLLLLAAAPALAPVGARRRWAAVGALGVGALLSAAAPGGLLVGPDGGYIPLAQALDVQHNARLYGVGWGALLTPIAAGDPLRVFAFNRWIAPLWPLLAVLGAAAAAPSLRALPLLLLGLCASLSGAFLRLVGAETPNLLLLLLEAAALALLLSGLRRPSAPGALAAGLLCGLGAHLRPEALALPALPVLAALVAPKRSRLTFFWAVPGLCLGLPRAVELLLGPRATGAVQAGDLLVWAKLHWVARDLAAAPAGLAAMAVVGASVALTGGRGRGPARLALGALLLSLGPVIAKSWPLVDGWRLQLPSFAAMLSLVGLGVARLGAAVGWWQPAWRRAAPALLLGGAAVTGLVGLRGAFGPWSPRAELAVLAELAAALPPDSTLLLADDTPNAKDQGLVVSALGRAGALSVLPMAEGPAAPRGAGGLYAFFGLRCAVGYPTVPGGPEAGASPCAELREACGLKPLQRWDIPSAGDLDLQWPAGPLRLELFLVEGCRERPQAQ